MIVHMDPYDPRLKPITHDSSIQCSEKLKMPAWNVRLHGDPEEYQHELTEGPQNTISKSFGVVVVRSMQWPGSFNFYY